MLCAEEDHQLYHPKLGVPRQIAAREQNFDPEFRGLIFFFVEIKYEMNNAPSGKQT
jgi:hypothetical protein